MIGLLDESNLSIRRILSELRPVVLDHRGLPEAIEWLGTRFEGQPHLTLILGDAVIHPLPPGPAWSVVGNLPYNAATPILTRLLVEGIPWTRLVLMFQLEVGQKLMGNPKSELYGPLSVLAQRCARLTRLMKLGPQAFRPAPKVDSVVLQFDPLPEVEGEAQGGAMPREDRAGFLKLLHRGFGRRRKTLSNNLAPELPSEATVALLAGLGLAPQIRAEALTPLDWDRFHGALRREHPQAWASLCKGHTP